MSDYYSFLYSRDSTENETKTTKKQRYSKVYHDKIIYCKIIKKFLYRLSILFDLCYNETKTTKKQRYSKVYHDKIIYCKIIKNFLPYIASLFYLTYPSEVSITHCSQCTLGEFPTSTVLFLRILLPLSG